MNHKEALMSRKTETQQETSTSLDAWRRNIARSFVPMEVRPDPHHSGSFYATVDRVRIGFISLSRVTSCLLYTSRCV